MSDVVRSTSERGHATPEPSDASRLFGRVEHAIAIGIGVFLSAAAVLALAGAAALVWDSVVQWPRMRSLFGVVDRLLFILMIVEILHTVRSSLQSYELAAEPFLVVAMIAAVRRILVVTLETSDRAVDGEGVGHPVLSFDHAMIELGILAAMILVLAIAIYLLRRARVSHDHH